MRGVKLGDRTCVVCGRHFEGSQHAKLCSPECLKVRRATHHNTTACICEVCGKSFRGIYNAKTCSNTCYASLMREKAKRIKTCDQCGNEFSGHYNATVCSPECRREKKRKYSLVRNKVVYELYGPEIQAKRKAKVAAMTPEEFGDWLARRRVYGREHHRRRSETRDAEERRELTTKLREYRRWKKAQEINAQLSDLSSKLKAQIEKDSDEQ